MNGQIMLIFSQVMLTMRRLSLFFSLFFLSLFCARPFVQDVQAALSAAQQKKGKPATALTIATANTKKSAATAKRPARTNKTVQPPIQQPAIKTAAKKTAQAPVRKQSAQTSKSAVKNPSPRVTKKLVHNKRSTKPSDRTVSAGKRAYSKKTGLTGASSKLRPVLYTSCTEIGEQISSKSAIILDADTGKELFAKAPDNPRQPASTIKIVTAMIALQSLQPDETIKVSDKAAAMPSSKIFLDPNKNYRADDLINAVLLASANDASVALAEKISGSEENFANLMTITARMWGARHTVCRTASGLTAHGQQSTARDLANLFRYAMQNEDFAGRMHEKSISTTYGKTLRNHNKALWRLDGTDGGKTGYTVAARQTYVGQFTRNNRTIVVALMGSESMWADLEKLVNYGFQTETDNRLAKAGTADSGRTVTRMN